MNIKEKAEQYAQNKIQQTLDKVVAEAYIEGYKQGYQDCKEEKTAELPEDEIEYVDLGLPSGTLWAKEYFKECSSQMFPYDKAMTINIPTYEQWKELSENCELETHYNDVPASSYVYLIGLNGNALKIMCYGYYEEDNVCEDGTRAYFWLKDTEDTNKYQSVAGIWEGHGCSFCRLHRGFKLPILLVK